MKESDPGTDPFKASADRRVARLCATVDLVLKARPLELDEPLMAHRHLSEPADRELAEAGPSEFPVDANTANAQAHENSHEDFFPPTADAIAA